MIFKAKLDLNLLQAYMIFGQAEISWKKKKKVEPDIKVHSYTLVETGKLE